MKKGKIYLIMALAISAGLTVFCVSIQDRTMTLQERAESEVVGTATAEFTTLQPVHIILEGSIKNKATPLLRAEASR